MSDIHLTNWLDRVEVDYYSMFIKSWIPFNAWYMKNFYDEDIGRTSDRNLIDYVKQNDNPYKTKIKNLLNGSSAESILFKNFLKELHDQLESISVPSDEKRIKLSSITLYQNTTRQQTISFNRRIYKFEFLYTQPRTTKRFKCTILQNNPAQTTIGIIEMHKCSIAELEQDLIFQNQNFRTQAKIKEGFNEINPQKPVNIVRTNGLHIKDTLYLENNVDKVTQVIIELVYQLRNKIFHGEINPNKALLKVYENAYLIQQLLVKSLT